MKKEQILDYDWEFGKEQIRLEGGSYMYGNRLYIGMLSKEPEGWYSARKICMLNAWMKCCRQESVPVRMGRK